MFFNSLPYLLFLPAVFLLYYLTAERFRWLVLLLASYSFYAALKVAYLPGILIFVTFNAFYFGKWIGKTENRANRRHLFQTAVVINFLVLCSMKYIPFLTGNLNALLKFFSFPPLLPSSPILVSRSEEHT